MKKSIVSLLLSNAIPIVGVIFFNWNMNPIVLAYALETLVVGLYSWLKFNKAKNFKPNEIEWLKKQRPQMKLEDAIRSYRTTMKIFIPIHLSIFTFVHILIINGFLITADPYTSFSRTIARIAIILIGPIISHGISYKENYIQTKKYLTASPAMLLLQPYKRVLIMHVAIFIIVPLSLLLPGRIFNVALIVIVKTTMDYFGYRLEHVKKYSAD